jgi:hypothetical protein
MSVISGYSLGTGDHSLSKEPHEDRQHYSGLGAARHTRAHQRRRVGHCGHASLRRRTGPVEVSGTGSIEADVPNGSGTVEVMFELKDGDKSNSVSFTYLKVY